jgi:hypothetical protein
VRPPTEALARLSLAQVLRSIGVPDLACAELRDTLGRLGPLPARLATRIRAELAAGCRQLGLRDEAAALFDAICADADALPPEEAAVYRINAASTWWQVGRLDQARAALADARRDLGPAGPAPLLASSNKHSCASCARDCSGHSTHCGISSWLSTFPEPRMWLRWFSAPATGRK